jgi:hypothetical protein
VIRALGLAGLCLGGIGYLYGHSMGARAPGPAHEPGRAMPAARAVDPARATRRPAASPARALAQPERPRVLAVVPTTAHEGESAYDVRLRVEAVADWERFRADAKLTAEQERAILSIVYDTQVELAGANEERWHVLSESRGEFSKFEADKLDTMQADLDAKVRAVLSEEQGHEYQDNYTIAVGRIELIGGLVSSAP